MVVDLFILGCIKEKPLNLDFLIETAKLIRLDKWTGYKRDLLLDRLTALEDLNFVKIVKDEKLGRHNYFLSTEQGIFYYKKEIKKYIDGEEMNMGMLILFLTFSSHFSPEEIREILQSKVCQLTEKVQELERLSFDKNEGLNTISYLSHKAIYTFKQKEMLVYMSLLEHVNSNTLNENLLKECLIESPFV